MMIWRQASSLHATFFLSAFLFYSNTKEATTTDVETTMIRIIPGASYPDDNPMATEWPIDANGAKLSKCCTLQKILFSTTPDINPGGINQLGAAFGRFLMLDTVKLEPDSSLEKISDDDCGASWNYTRDKRNDQDMPNNSKSSPFLDLSQIYSKTGENWFGMDSSVSGSFILTKDGMIATDCNNVSTTTQSNSSENTAETVPVTVDTNALRSNACVADKRMVEFLPVYALATIFMREHNRLAAAILKAETTLTPTAVFEKARNINIRQYQQISKEWITDVVGTSIASALIDGQEPEAGQTHHLYHEFAAGFAPTMASLLSNDILIWDNDNKQTMETLESHFENVANIYTTKLEPLLRGQLYMPAAHYDLRFPAAAKLAFDSPLNIPAMMCYKSRDHGLPDMAALRTGLTQSTATSYEEINIDTDIIELLKKLYPHLKTEGTAVGSFVDAPFGLLAESTIIDGAVGITAAMLIMLQLNLADNDVDGLRKYCKSPTGDAVAECESLKSTTMAKLILRNTGHQCTNKKAFFVAARSNIVGADLCRDALTSKYDKFGTLKELLTCKAPGCKDYEGTKEVEGYKTYEDTATWLTSNNSLSYGVKLTLILVFTIVPAFLLIAGLAWWKFRPES